jgi:hypothetical protein
MTVEEFKCLRVGQLVTDHLGNVRIIEKIGDTIICSNNCFRKFAFSIHDAERLTLLTEEWPKRITVYAHFDTLSMLKDGELRGLSCRALGLSKCELRGLVLEIEFHENGKYRILTVDGREVKE